MGNFWQKIEQLAVTLEISCSELNLDLPSLPVPQARPTHSGEDPNEKPSLC